MEYRTATREDVPLLAELNAQLIEDEAHRNTMSLEELADRMAGWISAEYTAVLFEENGESVAYSLYRIELEKVYLRQFFVVRGRRRSGIGRSCMRVLFEEVWPKDRRITVDVLVGNQAAISFWRDVGFADYCLTLEVRPD